MLPSCGPGGVFSSPGAVRGAKGERKKGAASFASNGFFLDVLLIGW
jgi:hypothetical protein